MDGYPVDRFSHYTTRYPGADGRVYDAEVYSFSGHGNVFDILVIDGYQFVRTNTGKLSGFINDWHPAHYAVVRHYNLKG